MTFDEFLKGNTSISRHKQVRPPSKNMASKTVTKYKNFCLLLKLFQVKCACNIAGVSLHLGAYFHLKFLNKKKTSLQKSTLQCKIDVLITLTNKLIWKFTSFLSSQVIDNKKFLYEQKKVFLI